MTVLVRNLPDQLVELVRNRILSGEMLDAVAVRQDALAAELGVSKIPLREALARLEEEGLLESRTNRGYFVRPMTTAELEEVYALRLKLEPDAMAVAAARATDADRAVAEYALAALERLTDAHAAEVGQANRAFHTALFEPAAQPVTSGILNRLHILSERYVRTHLQPLGRDDRANHEHREMLDAWLARDAARVAELTRQHTQKTLEDLREQLACAGSGPLAPS